MRRKIEKPVLDYGLYRSARPRLPREWLPPFLLRAGIDSGSCPLEKEEAECWLDFLGESKKLAKNGVRPSYDLWMRPTNFELFERLYLWYGAGSMDAASAVYTWGRAWHRYDAEVMADLVKRPKIEREAFGVLEVDAAIRQLQDGEKALVQEAVEHQKALRKIGIVAPIQTLPEKRREWFRRTKVGLKRLGRMIQQNPGEDGYVASCASGLRAEPSCLRLLRGWVEPYGVEIGVNRWMADGRSDICPFSTMIEAMVEGFRHANLRKVVPGEGRRPMRRKVPWLDCPDFVDEEAWAVPLCLWQDRALAKFIGVGETEVTRGAAVIVKDAGRAAADRVRALELDRPSFFLVGVSPNGSVIRLPKAVKRKAVPQGHW